MFSKEGIVPPLVIASATASFQMRSFSQDCPQASPYPAIQFPECPAVTVLEVSEPSACNPIDSHDGLIQTPSVGPVRQSAYAVLQLGHAFTPRPAVQFSFPRMLEVVSEKVEPRSRLVHVHDSGFLGVQTDPLRFHPRLQHAIGRFG